MNIVCTICSDLVNQAENIYVTRCGHLFHHNCLVKWIERSKTCPQCRNKVTDKCMYRLYPTVSNENSSEDAVALQSRLDDVQLQLRQQRLKYKEKEDKLSVANADLKRQDDLLKSYEKRLVCFDSEVLAFREQMEFLNAQNTDLQKDIQKAKVENEALKKNIQTLNGLQKVLNATSDDVEQMLHSYTDMRTIATFATALKRALCDSEAKKNEFRDRLHAAKQQLGLEKKRVGDLQSRVMHLEDSLQQVQTKYDILKTDSDLAELKRQVVQHRAEEHRILNDYPTSPQAIEKPHVIAHNSSFREMVKNIENSNSPYLSLQQGSVLSLAALQRAPMKLSEKAKPTEQLYQNAVNNATKTLIGEKSNAISTKHSIFHKKSGMAISSLDNVPREKEISYDGLGGHSKPDVFPVPNNNPVKIYRPKLSAKHKLKRPIPKGSQDIEEMFKKVKDK